MDYTIRPKYHYTPKQHWVNDPNGLCYYKGYYHLFYQHDPDSEFPGMKMSWGHARTKDFINWEEMPIALSPGDTYDKDGVWSGTAIIKDDVLYVFYASIVNKVNKFDTQTVSVAYSTDGINFTKYEGNPVIDRYPEDGSHDFRDPALVCVDGVYYCVMATGKPELKKARLVYYSSADLLHWKYEGVMQEWDNGKYAECPSIIYDGENLLVTCSVCYLDNRPHEFSVTYGKLIDGKFVPTHSASPEQGPDQYAGQVFRDDKGRNLFISWTPGWRYRGIANGKNAGTFSIPREIKMVDGKITAYPPKEVLHLLKDSDEFVKITEDGFIVERSACQIYKPDENGNPIKDYLMERTPVVYKGKIDDIKILRDSYLLEIFLNGGETNFTILL
jgi:beta-fructofuranosidase